MIENEYTKFLEDRDPDNTNSYLRLQFEDVFAEPSSTHSLQCVWVVSSKCFNLTKSLIYNILTFICGLILAFFWGCIFAFISFFMVWIIGPFLRLLHIVVHPFKKITQIMLTSFVGPIFEVYSLIFSRIHVTIAQGLPNKHFGLINGEKQTV